MAPHSEFLTALVDALGADRVQVGDAVPAGAELAVLEAMKMQHVLSAPHAGVVRALFAEADAYVAQGDVILVLEEAEHAAEQAAADQAAQDPDHIRADLQRVLDRHALTLDDARPEAIARRHARGGRTARENIADLCDEGSFIEYGALAIAAQTRRRSMEDLIANTPADGMVTGVGSVNEALFGPDHPQLATLLNNLGASLADIGRDDEAAALHARALAIKERALGPDHGA